MNDLISELSRLQSRSVESFGNIKGKLKSFKTATDNDPQDLANLRESIKLSSSSLKNIHKQCLRHTKACAGAVDTGHALCESLSVYGQAMNEPEFESIPLASCMETASNVFRSIDEAKNQLNEKMVNLLIIPIQQFLETDMREAKAARREFDKCKHHFEAVNAKVQDLADKPKSSMAKLAEANAELEEAKKEYAEALARTRCRMKMVSSKNCFSMVEQFTLYFEAIQEHTRLLNERSQEIAPHIETFKKLALQMRKEFVATHPDATPDITPASSTRTTTSKYRMSHMFTPHLHTKKDVRESLSPAAPVAAAQAAPRIPEQLEQVVPAMDPKEEKFAELLLSEASFISLLDDLLKLRDDMMKDARLTPKGKQRECEALFQYMAIFQMHHKLFVKDLEGVMDNFAASNKAGPFLKNMKRFEESHAKFASEFLQISDALRDSRLKSRSFDATVKTWESQVGRDMQTCLCSALQRIDDYCSFLQVFCELPGLSASEKTDFAAALRGMKAMSASISHHSALTEQAASMLRVQRILVGYKGDLMDPNRSLLREGDLHLIQNGKKRHRHLFLFNDSLVFSKQTVKNIAIPKWGHAAAKFLDQHSEYQFEGQVILNDFAVSPCADPKNSFTITVGLKSFQLIANSVEERAAWVAQLESVQQGNDMTRVFGQSLQDVMDRESGSVPAFVLHCAEFLLENGTDCEGIFRLSGNQDEIDKWRHMVDQGRQPSFPASTDPHVVAGLLKLWLRNLPEPILTFELYNAFLQAGLAHLKDEGAGEDMLKAALQRLPRTNMDILRLLINLLSQVAKNVDKTKMSSNNLSIVFGPTLLARRGASPFDTSEYQTIYQVVAALINKFPRLFPAAPAQTAQAAQAAPKLRPQDFPKKSLPVSPRGAALAATPGADAPGPAPTSPRAGPTPKAAPMGPLSTSSHQPTRALPVPAAAPPSAPPSSTPPAAPATSPFGDAPLFEANFDAVFPEVLPPSGGTTSMHAVEDTEKAAAALAAAAAEEQQKKREDQEAEQRRLEDARREEAKKEREAKEAEQRRQEEARRVEAARRERQQKEREEEERLKKVKEAETEVAQRAQQENAKKLQEARLKQQMREQEKQEKKKQREVERMATSERLEAFKRNEMSGQSLPNTCHACTRAIEAHGLIADNKKWHTSCLVCAECMRSNFGKYTVRDGRILCQADYEKLYVNVCCRCRSAISGAWARVGERAFHTHHFTCEKCGRSMLDEGYAEVDGELRCGNCC